MSTNLITDKVDQFQKIQTAKTEDRRNRYIHSPISIKEFKQFIIFPEKKVLGLVSITGKSHQTPNE